MTNKNGKDVVDGFLYFASQNNDPIHFADYPERVVSTLRAFYNTWKIPSYIIPSKKSKSKYEEWIVELDELNGICPNSKKMEEAIKRCLQRYESGNKFNVVRPASIRGLLTTIVSEMKREEESQKTQVKEVVPSASLVEKKQVISDLKLMFKDTEE